MADFVNREKILLKASKYYNINTISKLIAPDLHSFTVLSLNVQSLIAKFDDLKLYIYELSRHSVSFDAICLQETWIPNNSITTHLNIDGYQLIIRERTCGKCGGLAIYLRDDLHFKSIDVSFNNIDDWEAQFIEIKHNGNRITLGNIYRPPRNLKQNQEHFMNDLDALLYELESISGINIIAGDFNINLLKINENSFSNLFLEKMISYNYVPMITSPTHYTINNQGTLIDNIFYRNNQLPYEVNAGIVNHMISDHHSYFLSLNTNIRKPYHIKFITINTYNDQAILNLKEELRQIDYKDILDYNHDACPDENYNKFIDLITKAINKHLPSKRVKFNKRKHRKSQWMTIGIITSINFRDRLYHKLKKTKILDEKYHILKNNLKVYNKILKQAIKEAKSNYYDKYFTKYINDPRKTWDAINNILGRSKKSKQSPTEIIACDQVYKDKKDMADQLNVHFTNIGAQLASEIPITSCQMHNFRHYMNEPTNNIFKMKTVSEEEIIKIIEDLKPKFTPDMDRISNKLLKNIKYEICSPLTAIINQSITKGIFPNKLKIAKVTPIKKTPNAINVNDFRPISILPSISKIFENIIHRQLLDYFEQNKLLYKSQYGFRKGHSTEMACQELIDKLLWMMEDKLVPIGIFIDMTKAFDTIDHGILLSKLEFYGIKGTELQLLQSYLTNRKQFTVVDENPSDLGSVITGVPQGSILGPLIFNIYINDINNASDLFEMITYADDTTLITSMNVMEKHPHKINKELENISTWLKINRLTVNTKKTKFMIFQNAIRNHLPMCLLLNGERIESVNSFNYLGITIDTKLTFKEHINKVSHSIARMIGCLRAIKRYLSEHVLRKIYMALIQSKIYYGILVWGHVASKLSRLQKQAIRVISKAKYNAHTNPLFKYLKILKIEDIYLLQIYKLYYKIINQNVPEYFKNLLIKRANTIHSHHTRNSSKFFLPNMRLAQTKTSTSVKVSALLNNTEFSLYSKIETHSLQGFSTYYKTITIQKYPTECNISNCYICNNL